MDSPRPFSSSVLTYPYNFIRNVSATPLIHEVFSFARHVYCRTTLNLVSPDTVVLYNCG